MPAAFILERPARSLGMCLCGRTCGHTTLYTRCGPRTITSYSHRQLGYDYPGSICILALYMHWEFLNKTAQCKPCTEIGRNLKPVILVSKWQPLRNCSEPNQEIQLDFVGPITSEKDHDILSIACIDRFSKLATVEVFDKAH